MPNALALSQVGSGTLGSPIIDVAIAAGYGVFIAEEFVIADGKELALLDGAEVVIL